MKGTSKPQCSEGAIGFNMMDVWGQRNWVCMDVYLHVLIIRAYFNYRLCGAKWLRTTMPIDGTGEWPYQLLWHSCPFIAQTYAGADLSKSNSCPCKHPHAAYAVEGGVVGSLIEMGKSKGRLLTWRASSVKGNVMKASSNHRQVLFLD